MQNTKLIGANLRGATLSGVQMQDADLWGAQLQNAFLNSVELKGAKLSRVTISAKTQFVGARWWEADFGSGMGPYSFNRKLLEELYRRYGKEVPKDRNEVHPSARGFIAEKRREEQA